MGWTTYLDTTAECIGEDYDYQPYSTEASDVWALGVILTNLVAGRNPWNLAVSSDKNYLEYLADPCYLRKMLPISMQASEILRAIFNPDPVARIPIHELRMRVREVTTFFMTDEEIANADKYAKMAAESYRPSKPNAEPVNREERYLCQSIVSDAEARALLEDSTSSQGLQSEAFMPKQSYPSKPPALPPRRTPGAAAAKFVIAPSEGISPSSSSSSSSSGGESDEPVTPMTHAQEPSTEVPVFTESEKVGEAIVPTQGRQSKCLSMPLSTVFSRPVALAIRA